MLVLYQFAISHYCEKIRWALAFKKLEYEVKNLLPGPHILTTRKLAADTAVPILVHDGRIVQNSSDIISYLDATFPQHGLTPADQDLRDDSLRWERYLDKEIGIHIRRYFYHTLLQYPSVLIPLFTYRGPWYGPLMYRLIFPTLRKRMRDFLNINATTAQTSRKRVERAITRLSAHLRERDYLVGDRFTRADLTAASLLALLCRPPQYGLDWPHPFPGAIESMIENNLEKLRWVEELYRMHYPDISRCLNA